MPANKLDEAMFYIVNVCVAELNMHVNPEFNETIPTHDGTDV